VTVLRRGYVPVEPDTSGFDEKLKEQFRRQDPGGKAGKQLGGQLNRALKRLDIDPINVKADPKQALAAIKTAEARLQDLSSNAGSVEIKVKTQQALNQLGRFRKQLGDLGDKTAPALGDRLNDALSRLDLKPIDITADPRDALAAIREAEEDLERLGRFASSIEVKVKTQQALGELGRFRKQLGDVAESAGPDAASGFVARFSQRLGPLVTSIPISGPLGIAVGAGAAIVAPTLAATLAGAVVGGVGIGGIAGGIALVAKDPAVAGYGKSIGQNLVKGLKSEAEVFKAPVLQALGQIESRAQQVLPKIGKIFDNTSPSVKGLTTSLLDAGEAMIDSFVSASAKSEPAIQAIGDLVENLSGEVGHLITTLSDNSEAGASAIDDLSGSLGNMIRVTTGVVDALAGAKSALDSLDDSIDDGREWLEDHVSWLDITADGYGKNTKAAELYRKGLIGVAGSVDDYDDYLEKAAAGTNTLAGKMTAADKAARGQLTAMTELSKELKAQTDPVFGLLEAQNGLKKAQDAATEAIKKHGAKSEEARQATRNLATAAIDLQGKAGALGDTFDGKMSPALRNTLKAAGLTKTQIKGVEKELKDARGAADKYAGTYRAYAELKNDDKVTAQLKRLSAYQAALKKGMPVKFHGPVKGKDGLYYDRGGWTGPGATHDEAGIVHADEFVIKKSSRRKIEQQAPGLLDEMNTTGRAPGYDKGGRVWPFATTAEKTRIPSRAEVAAVVIPAAPTGGATAPWMERLLESRFGVNMISGYRPGSRTLSGNTSYHASNRAVDFPPLKAMARFMHDNYKSRLREAITPYQEYNVHNGRSRRWTGAVWNQHNFAGGNAHNHFAMDNGGTLEPGWNPPIYNGTGRPEPVTPAKHFDTLVAEIRTQNDLLERVLGAMGDLGGDVAAALATNSRLGVQRSRQLGVTTRGRLG
jgi:hypothetical protein